MSAPRGPFAGDGPFVQFLRRISLNYGGFDFVRGLDVYAQYSPLRTFAIFGSHDHDARAAAIAALRLTDKLERAEVIAARPVHDGYIALLEFTPGERATEHGPHLDAFFEREDRRDVEDHLRACYGRDYEPEAGVRELFDFMDYPVFDNGTGCLGYGVMVPADSKAPRWLWSRASFAHK